MNSLLCLCFVQALSGQSAQIPDQVDQLAKSRITQQMKNQRGDLEFAMGDSDCPRKGRYFYTADSIILEAENDLWRGRLTVSLTDILDGKGIDFYPLVKVAAQDLPSQTTSPLTLAMAMKPSLFPSKTSHKWLWWGLAAAGALTVGILASQSRHHDSGSSAPPIPDPALSNQPGQVKH